MEPFQEALRPSRPAECRVQRDTGPGGPGAFPLLAWGSPRISSLLRGGWLLLQGCGNQSPREAAVARQLKVIVEKHPDRYGAYPLGLKGVVVGEGETYDAALADVRSAIKFH